MLGANVASHGHNLLADDPFRFSGGAWLLFEQSSKVKILLVDGVLKSGDCPTGETPPANWASTTCPAKGRNVPLTDAPHIHHCYILRSR
jgi:hypothetical protein